VRNLPADDYAALARAVADADSVEPWREQAACRDPAVPALEFFFPDGGNEMVGAHGVRRARLFCARCPVRLSCSVVALTEEADGIWAGHTRSMREAVAALPLPERVRTLDEQFHRIATRGPWRVVDSSEWRELGCGERQAGDHADVRPQGVLSA